MRLLPLFAEGASCCVNHDFRAEQEFTLKKKTMNILSSVDDSDTYKAVFIFVI